MSYVGSLDDADELRELVKGKPIPVKVRLECIRSIKAMFEKHRDEWCEALRKDLGSSRHAADLYNVTQVIKECEYFISNLHSLAKPRRVPTPITIQPGWSDIVPKPLGVVLVMGCWNFPLNLTWIPAVDAIAAGNAVIIKIPEINKACDALTKSLWKQRKYYKIFTGGPARCVDILNKRFDKICFTGSTEHGKGVLRAAAEFMTPCILECGGRNPVYVCESADLKIASSRLSWLSFMNSGQLCMRPNYIMVHKKVQLKFLELFRSQIVEQWGKDPTQSDFARMVTERHWQRQNDLCQATEKAVWFQHGTPDKADRFFPPTVFLNPGFDSKVFTEEIFGPMVSVITVDGPGNAVDIINNGEKPLSTLVFTSKASLREKFTYEISTGGLDFNFPVGHYFNNDVMFGGVGMSGMGGYKREAGFEQFSHMQPVYTQTAFVGPLFNPLLPPHTDHSRLPFCKDNMATVKLAYKLDECCFTRCFTTCTLDLCCCRCKNIKSYCPSLSFFVPIIGAALGWAAYYFATKEEV